MNQELLKKRLQNNLNRVVAEFQAREDIICRFENPRIAYVDAEDTRFDALFARGYNDHPKKIYRCIVTTIPTTTLTCMDAGGGRCPFAQVLRNSLSEHPPPTGHET